MPEKEHVDPRPTKKPARTSGSKTLTPTSSKNENVSHKTADKKFEPAASTSSDEEPKSKQKPSSATCGPPRLKSRSMRHIKSGTSDEEKIKLYLQYWATSLYLGKP